MRFKSKKRRNAKKAAKRQERREETGGGFFADGMLRNDGWFTMTLPAHVSATNRDHSWRHDWMKSVISAMDNIEAAGERVVVTVDFATGPPGNSQKDGAIVIKSHESGGEILRREDGAWVIVGHQPMRETMQ